MFDPLNFDKENPSYRLLINKTINLNMIQKTGCRIEIKLMTKKFMGYGEDILLCSGQIKIKQFLNDPEESEKKLRVRLISNENVQIATI